MGDIRIGTSGYAYADWVGPVYPRGTKPADYLARYAELFDTCELNFTHYAIPKASTLASMVTRTRGRMSFAVKVHQSITHERTGDPAELVSAFREPLAPLREAAVLEAVLLQFPQSFHREREQRLWLAHVLDAFAADPLVLELRHKSWESEHVFDELRRRGVALCLLDEPALPGLFHPPRIATSRLGYVRFHGRNAAAWYHDGDDRNARYDYRYAQAELEPWVSTTRTLAEQVDRLLVYFNNHPRGQAVEGARLLKAMLRGEPAT